MRSRLTRPTMIIQWYLPWGRGHASWCCARAPAAGPAAGPVPPELASPCLGTSGVWAGWVCGDLGHFGDLGNLIHQSSGL